MTREKHIEWCKQRALEYIDINDINQAWASMCSDLGKHSETFGHSGIELGTAMIMAGHLSSQAEMRKFILGFN